MIFISYAKEDRDFACELYAQLHACNLDPWMDKPPSPHEANGLQIGQRWQTVLSQKLQAADNVVLILSPRSVRKRGYVQVEFRTALSLMNEMPDDQIYILPIVSESCEIPALHVGQINLKDIQWEEVRFTDIPDFAKRLADSINGRKP